MVTTTIITTTRPQQRSTLARPSTPQPLNIEMLMNVTRVLMIAIIMPDASTLSVVTNAFATMVTKVMVNTVTKKTLMNVPMVLMDVTNTQHAITHMAVILALVTVATMAMVTVANKIIPMNVPLDNTTVPLMLNAKIQDGVSNASASRDTAVMVSIVKLITMSHQLQLTHVKLQTVLHMPHVFMDHMVVPLVNVNQVTLDLAVVIMVVTMLTSAITVPMVAQAMQDA